MGPIFAGTSSSDLHTALIPDSILFQLAEAILSHSEVDEETNSIYLEDTRSNRRFTMDHDECDADETRHLVDSDLEELIPSRTAFPEQEDCHHPRIMTNNEARVSQMDINVSSDQMPHDTSPLHRPKKNTNGLSSQAGAILVSTPDFCSWSHLMNVIRAFTTYLSLYPNFLLLVYRRSSLQYLIPRSLYYTDITRAMLCLSMGRLLRQEMSRDNF